MIKIILKNLWLALITIFLVNLVNNVAFGWEWEMPFDNDDVGLENYKNKDTPVKVNSNNNAEQINNLIFAIVNWFLKILGSLATVWIIWQGFALISADGEELDKVKKSLQWSIGGLVGSFLVVPLILGVFYGGGNDLKAGEGILKATVSTLTARTEIEGLMAWIKVFLGIGAVAMIILTGVKSMFSTEDTTDAIKNNIISIVIGIIIIALNDVMIKFGLYGIEGNTSGGINNGSETVTITRDSTAVIKELAGLSGFILTFFGTIAVAAISYGGFLVVTASFNEEQADKGKAIIINVIIGSVIAFISYTLVRTLIFL